MPSRVRRLTAEWDSEDKALRWSAVVINLYRPSPFKIEVTVNGEVIWTRFASGIFWDVRRISETTNFKEKPGSIKVTMSGLLRTLDTQEAKIE